MKRTHVKHKREQYAHTPPVLLALLLIVAFFLVSCVRPVPGSPTPTTAAPVIDPTLPAATLPPATLPGEEVAPTLEVVPPEGGDPTQPTTEAPPVVDPAATATIPAEQQPTIAPEATQPAPEPPPATGGEQTHVVQRGENLFRIGLRYGCPYQTLAQYNGIADPARIDVGQVIRIPANC